MKIKTKIVVSNSVLVAAAVAVILLAVMYILDRNIDQQNETLLNDLHAQSERHINATNQILQRLVGDHIANLKRETAGFCLNESVREGVHKGQWKSVFARAEYLCQKAGMDFLVVFDANGRLQVGWPSSVSSRDPEKHFDTLQLFNNFKPYLDAEEFIDVPIFSIIQRWGRKVLDAYGIEIQEESGIVVLSVGIIPNDYFDEPLGYVMTGITSRRLSAALLDFSKITGQFSLLADGNTPLAWAGLTGEKEDIGKSLDRFRRDRSVEGLLDDTSFRFMHAGHEYNIHAHEIVSLSALTTSVDYAAASVLLISGESTGAYAKASANIRQAGGRTENNVLFTALLLTLFILALTVIVMNLIGTKISRPVETAADISDEIAAGNLDHVLEASGSDETGRLSRSMNKMIKNLKDMVEKNEKHLKAIEAIKERIEKILETIQEGVLLVKADTRKIIDVNPAAAGMIEAEREEIIGDDYNNYIFKNSRQKRFDGQYDSLYAYNDHTLLTKDGKQLTVLKTSAPIELEEGQCFLETFLDITPLKQVQAERAKLEHQLQQAKKMEAIGLLAGGVAHDLNNVLSGIVSYPDLLLMHFSKEDPMHKSLNLIKKSGERASQIVEDLLTLARRGVTGTEAVNLNEILDEYLRSPEYKKLLSFHSEIHVTADLDSDLLNIKGSPVHLSKTIMNLISNAAEAMPDGGQVIISTENRYIDSDFEGYNDIREGDYAVLKVKDTGIGISPEDQERIFEPFYTKKIMGRSGTGLGMAVVWGTVKDHRGYIDVQSSPGKGTTFFLYFPATRQTTNKEKQTFAVDEYRGNGESILVVDDVQEQREIAAMILSELGYRVETVSSGEAAVEHIKAAAVDLLVLDMVMDPGMDGLDTYMQILQIRPGQKAIITSGFAETERVIKVQKLGVGRYIKKPYTMEKIAFAARKEINK